MYIKSSRSYGLLAESRDRVLTAKDRSGQVNTVRYSKTSTILRKGKWSTNCFSSSDRFFSCDSRSLTLLGFLVILFPSMMD
jgi:hypothetical protein